MGTPAISAGGIVLRSGDDGNTEIVIVERDKGVEEKWAPVLRQLPKGQCKPRETLEETALREVLEETGYTALISGKAGEAKWSYTRNNELWDETVHYYFMETLAIASQPHDQEFDHVRWIDIREAAILLSYPEERELLTRIITETP